MKVWVWFQGYDVGDMTIYATREAAEAAAGDFARDVVEYDVEGADGQQHGTQPPISDRDEPDR